MTRPSLCTPAMIKKTRAYIKDYEDHGHAFPSGIGLADVLGVSRKTIHNWGEANEEFAAVMEQLDTAQQMVAWRKGLNGEYNANLVKLLLGKHGYSDKAENTVKGGITVTLSPEHDDI